MLLFWFFLHLIEYSQRNVNISHYDFFSFSLYFFWTFALFVYLNFCFIYLCSFVLRCLMLGVFVVMMSILLWIVLFLIKIFIFVSFKINKLKKKKRLMSRLEAFMSGHHQDEAPVSLWISQLEIIKWTNTKKVCIFLSLCGHRELLHPPDLMEWNSPNSSRKVVRTTLCPFSDGGN